MMRRPSPVSLPYFLTAVVAVLMASFLLGAAETVLPSAGHPVIVLVEGTPDRNVSAVDSWMSTYSQRQHVAVGRWQADLNNPESSRGLYLVSAAGGTLNPFPKGYPNLSSQMITHIAHMDQDQSTDRSGEYLVYGNAADATTFASGMSALGFRSSVQGQVNLGLVASHNPDIIKAYGGMMGGISRPGHGGGVRPDSALRYSPFARSLVAASCRPRNSSCGVRRSHRHRSNGFDQCADPRLLQRFSSMDAMVSLVSPDMDTIRRSTPHSRDRDVGHRMVKRRNPGSGQGSNDQSPGLLRLVSASLSGGHVGDTADSFSHLCHTGTVTL